MQIDKNTLQQIETLKELVLVMINSQLIPLRKQLEQLDKNDLITRQELINQLHEAEKEFAAKYDALVELCTKHGMYIETTMARYNNLN